MLIRKFVGFGQETEEANTSQDAMVDLEMDELNQHECMATMTGLIGHMLRNNITPKIEPVSGTEEALINYSI